ncbi:MAG: HAMP domain-containing histidine kinase, partial [Lachnospiraceae bacterium]|nr:HAMP domain-containing histidine kinase [Lachnospiraceae bacterium]
QLLDGQQPPDIQQPPDGELPLDGQQPPEGAQPPESVGDFLTMSDTGIFGVMGFGTGWKYDDLNEVRFDARFFSVICDSNGSVVSSDISRMASVSDEKASELVNKVYGSSKGYADRFYYVSRQTYADGEVLPEGQLRYVFLDSSRELATFESFLVNSIRMGLLGLGLFFALIVFFSRIVLRPVEESYAKQKRFITDASHEIKTPLGIISANTEVIEMDNGESEWTRSIRHQIERLTSLTEKLVFLSRMDEEKNDFAMKELDISKLTEDTARSYEAVAQSEGKELSISTEPGLLINGDEDKLRQALSLLLDNAFKYSDDGGRIDIRIVSRKKNRHRVRLTVANTVEMIELGEHNEMFERFYRADDSRSSRRSGHGIGLAVVRAIIEAHSGTIRAISEDGRSIEFRVDI